MRILVALLVVVLGSTFLVNAAQQVQNRTQQNGRGREGRSLPQQSSNGQKARNDMGQMQSAPSDDPVERGRYIVHDVAMCIYCHTPRTAGGQLIEEQLLRGARMPIASPYPNQQWCFEAPPIAGLPGGYSEEEFIRFMQTGQRPRQTPPPRPPMPPFRMTRQDAEAVTAYLKSLR